MKKITLLMAFTVLTTITNAQESTPQTFEKDIIPTELGDLTITAIGHGTLMLEAAGKVVHIDPVTAEADYSLLPKADLILITHEHGDHLDLKAIETIKQPATQIIVSQSCDTKVAGALVLKNGESKMVGNWKIEAVPAYNLVHKRPDGNVFHPKGNGNGYVINYGGKRIYIAGDTENIPEMANLEGIDIAFLPMNLPYTMTPEMVASAWKSFRPAILYPYHFGKTDTSIIQNLLKDEKVEIRIRQLQ